MTNDEKINFIYGITRDIRRFLNGEDFTLEVEQNLSDALVYLDCAKNNLIEVHEDKKDVFRVAPTIVARAAK